MSDPDVISSEAWLHSLDIPVDHDVLDQVADVVMDGMVAIGGGTKNIPARMMVLVKLQAMMLAALRRTGDPEAEAIAAGFITSIGGALEHEIHRFTKAVQKDERRARRAIRSVS